MKIMVKIGLVFANNKFFEMFARIYFLFPMFYENITHQKCTLKYNFYHQFLVA